MNQNSWLANDKREIDLITRDYIVDQNGFGQMNSVSQRCYIALSRIDFKQPKKTPNLQEHLRTAIQDALKDMVAAGEVRLNDIRMNSSTGTLWIEIDYTNMTLNQNLTISVGA